MIAPVMAGTLRIGIVEDEAEERERLSLMIHFCMQNLRINASDYELYLYENAEDFTEVFGKGLFHVVFLDIKLGAMNGIEAAREIRRSDQGCRIIFLTKSTAYVEESYSVRATHYLTKPTDFVRLMEAFRFCNLHQIMDNPCIPARRGRRLQTISVDKIFYIEYVGRKTHIHLRKDVIVSDETFSAATAPLENDRRFLHCYRGVMVNMEYVAELDGYDFLMVNGDRVRVVVRHLKKIRDAWDDFRQERLR